jgi:hypothetical protein
MITYSAMALDHARAKALISGLLREISSDAGQALTDSFSGLRAVDAKVREAKLVLRDAGANALVDEMERDSDFQANSRRVRLESLANYCRTAVKFFETGALEQKKQLFKGPDLTKITQIMPELEPIIQARWLEAQRCQHAGAYLAAVIIMGSILEALLLARCSMSPSDAYQSSAAPKDRNSGKNIALHDWSLSVLIDVSVSKLWLKTDRGGFSHALRQSRNIVHPYEQARSGANFDEATCKVCWQVLNASVDDLLASV